MDESPETFAFHRAWDRFEAWLAKHSPADHQTLKPPAEPEQIAAVEAQYGFPLHPELKALLQRHNGSPHDGSSGTPGAFLPGRHSLDTTEFIISHHGTLVSLTEDWAESFPDWRADYHEEPLEAHMLQWVPFAKPNDGGFIFVDHCPGPTYGHVYEAGLGSGGGPEEWASNLTELFTVITDALEQGAVFKYYEPAFELDPSGQRFLDW